VNRAERKKLFDQIDLYPVFGELEVLAAVIAGGARIVQLRAKKISDRDILDLAKKFRKITAEHGVLLVINDRVDLALATEADGVHLGQSDLPVETARRLAPELLIGASTHDLGEALAAEKAGADYINIGPIFSTRTKDCQPIGVEAIKQIAPKISLPFTVMGGIKLENVESVLAAGAKRVAVVTALTQAIDIEKATRDLILKIRDPLEGR
jgi:thiamine-phosphate pyrophosphorylase